MLFISVSQSTLSKNPSLFTHEINRQKMKNLIVFYDDELRLRTELQDIPVPTNLKPHEVLIKVEVAGSNPKDWKHPLPAYFNVKINQGDDCAG